MSWRNCCTWLAIPILAHSLQAHTISLTYAEVRVDERQVVWSLKLPIPELDLLLGLDENHDGQVDASEISRSENKVRQYVLSKLGVLNDGREVPGAIGGLRHDRVCRDLSIDRSDDILRCSVVAWKE